MGREEEVIGIEGIAKGKSNKRTVRCFDVNSFPFVGERKSVGVDIKDSGFFFGEKNVDVT